MSILFRFDQSLLRGVCCGYFDRGGGLTGMWSSYNNRLVLECSLCFGLFRWGGKFYTTILAGIHYNLQMMRVTRSSHTCYPGGAYSRGRRLGYRASKYERSSTKRALLDHCRYRNIDTRYRNINGKRLNV